MGNYLRYSSGKERFQRVCLIGKKRRKYTLVKSFQMFCFILFSFLTSVALILAKLLLGRLSSMLSNTQLQARPTPPPPIMAPRVVNSYVLKTPTNMDVLGVMPRSLGYTSLGLVFNFHCMETVTDRAGVFGIYSHYCFGE